MNHEIHESHKKEKKGFVPTLRFPEFRDAGEWNATKLGEITEFVSERIPIEKLKLADYVSTENILSDYMGVTVASKLPTSGSATTFRPNDTLVSNIRPYLKKVWLSDKVGGASNDVIVIRAKNRLLTKYFPFLLKNDAFINYVMLGAKGVKMPRGDIAAMKEYTAYYPSLPEQQKIADCLSSLDELIAAHNQKLTALKLHKKGLMQQLFPAVGETVPRLRFPEFRDAGEWEEKRLGDMARLRNGYAFKSTEYAKGGLLKIITIANVQTGDLNIKSTNRIAVLPTDIQQHQVLSIGDILISMTGNVGRVCRVTAEGLLLNQRVGKLIPDAINSSFFYQLLQRGEFRNTMQLKAAGGAQGNLSGGAITEYGFTIPTEPAEQQKIADCLTSLDELIAAQAQKIEALKMHKKGLMQQLFPLADGGEE